MISSMMFVCLGWCRSHERGCWESSSHGGRDFNWNHRFQSHLQVLLSICVRVCTCTCAFVTVDGCMDDCIEHMWVSTCGSACNWLHQISNNIRRAILNPSHTPMPVSLDSRYKFSHPAVEPQRSKQLIFKAHLKMIFCFSFSAACIGPVAIFCLTAPNSAMLSPNS